MGRDAAALLTAPPECAMISLKFGPQELSQNPAEIVSKVKGGETMDADILQELYERYYSRAMLYALSLCGDEELAKDLVSESFVRAYLSLSGETPSFPYWLMRVCKNLWLDHVRRHRRLTPLEEAAAIPSPDTPETVYLQSERSRALWKAIGKLSPLDREIVTLHYYSGLPLQQVACLAGRSYGATRQRLSRLRQKLKTELEEQGYDF